MTARFPEDKPPLEISMERVKEQKDQGQTDAPGNKDRCE